MSRFSVLQPQRVSQIMDQVAEQTAIDAAELRRRSQVIAEDYDQDLHWRVLEAYIAYLCGLLEQVGEAGCDLVLLPECCVPVGDCYVARRERLAAMCQPGEALWLERTAPLARKHGMIIASCYYRREGDRLYNDGVLMNERGEVAGIYHKVHLPCGLDWEATEAGLFVAGTEYRVFETRVGRVGFQICYDIDFPEGCRCLALNGAEIILHPTVGYNFPDEEEIVAEARLRTRATDNSALVLYANYGPTPGCSAIYDKNGNQAACCGRGSDKFVLADLKAQAPRMQDWGHVTHDHRDHLTRKRRPDTYGVLSEVRPASLKVDDYTTARVYVYAPEVGLE